MVLMLTLFVISTLNRDNKTNGNAKNTNENNIKNVSRCCGNGLYWL